MKTLWHWIGLTAALTIVFHLLGIWLLPRVLMEVSLSQLTPHNQIQHRPQVGASSRDVVRQSPDLLYSACVYDVSEGPVRVSAAVPDSYFSISMFTMTTDNFFVINDQAIEGDRMDLIVVGEDDEYSPGQGERVVQAPTERGLILFRMLVEDLTNIDQMIALRESTTCQAASN